MYWSVLKYMVLKVSDRTPAFAYAIVCLLTVASWGESVLEGTRCANRVWWYNRLMGIMAEARMAGMFGVLVTR